MIQKHWSISVQTRTANLLGHVGGSFLSEDHAMRWKEGIEAGSPMVLEPTEPANASEAAYASTSPEASCMVCAQVRPFAVRHIDMPTVGVCQMCVSAATSGAEHELECVMSVLDAHNVPLEITPGQPYTVHGRVAEALDARRLILPIEPRDEEPKAVNVQPDGTVPRV